MSLLNRSYHDRLPVSSRWRIAGYTALALTWVIVCLLAAAQLQTEVTP